VTVSPDHFVQEIVWHRLLAHQPTRRGSYRIRNDKGHESIGYFFPETDEEDAGWVTMDFSGSIIFWAELDS
jgi:hypothetical protein